MGLWNFSGKVRLGWPTKIPKVRLLALGANHRIYGSIPKGIRVELTVLLASWSRVPGPRGGYI